MDNEECVYGYKRIAALLRIGPDLLKQTIAEYADTPTPFPLKKFGGPQRPKVWVLRSEVDAWRRSLPTYTPGQAAPSPALDRRERDEHIITFHR